MLLLVCAQAFVLPQTTTRPLVVRQGIFDVFKNAFANEEFDDRRVKASHILVGTEAEALDVKKAIDDGQSFKDAAAAFSTCPSAKSGGSLGVFEPGKMVAEFDAACFDENNEVGVVLGPVKTQFGHHLILIEDRFENQIKSEGSAVF